MCFFVFRESIKPAGTMTSVILMKGLVMEASVRPAVELMTLDN
jgi:hypothetical protein